MGQRNMIYTGPILEAEHTQLHPEACIIPYAGLPNFPQPTNNNNNNNIINNNNHQILPPQQRTTFTPQQHIPENLTHLPHGITQYNNVLLTPRVYPIHGVQEQVPFNVAFKRKNVQYFYGSSSSGGLNPMNNNNVDGVVMTHGSGVDPVLIVGNYGGQPIQAAPNLWLDQPFCGNNGAFSWNHGHGMPYLQGPINGGGMDAANIGLHNYQIAPTNRNSTTFVHPPPHQGPHTLHHPPPPPMPPMQAHSMEFHPQLASTSRRIVTNIGVNPFQNGLDNGPNGPRFVGPTPPTGVRVYRPHRREMMVDANARHRGFPHLRVLPEDGVAILDISGYHEVGHSVDHHRDMRLDIDHMSYEELLALGEQIGSVGSGLSDHFILKHLKTRVFASSKPSSNPEGESSDDQELNSCVICQTNYDDKEQIGVLNCGHEYHVECVKKWLIVKNTCPVCKSTALSANKSS